MNWRLRLKASADQSEKVKELFSASSIKLTPSPAQHAVFVLYSEVLQDVGATSQCASVLSSSERRRADRFFNENLRTNFIQRRAFHRYCGALALGSVLPLSHIAFSETDNGRPFLLNAEQIWFSFSSCNSGFLGAWASEAKVGVDLVERSEKVEASDLADLYFSKAEACLIERKSGTERRDAFLELWCLKEAALKSIGQGLPFGLDQFEFELSPCPEIKNAPSVHGGPEAFAASLIHDAKTVGAIVSRTVV